ncbi:MAG TPA: hypothetical protein VL201_03585 [Patescibacteria group bacterium]|jgi:hypothetical protein|nr:hypothetical protein [Patescibacteria group bacterium]
MIIYIFVGLLSLLSTAIMAYISMATSIGPWIAPTLLLLLYALSGLFRQKVTVMQLLGITSGASIGGIAATACGFSFPAIFFLDPVLYRSLIEQPSFFIVLLGGLVLLAGWFGIQIANFFESSLLQNEMYQFPVGQIIFTMASAGYNRFQAMQLWAGGILFSFWAWAQQGTPYGRLPAALLIKSKKFFIASTPALRFDLTVFPLLISIGFVTGHVIAKPLFVGVIGRLCVLNPMHNTFFLWLSASEFLLAFCAGMVLCGAIHTVWLLPKALKRCMHHKQLGQYKKAVYNAQQLLQEHIQQLGFFLIIFFAAASYLKLSFLVQLYVLSSTFLCVYQMIVIGATMGIAPLGRFATFVMVPALFLFSLDYVQLICIATFVEVAGGTAVDILFSRKASALAGIPRSYIMRMQYLGLCMASVGCAVIFLFLSSKFQLGSSVLGAYKAQARALLIHAHQFNYIVVLLGIFGGWILGKCKINPSMVLGGILMPIDYSLALIIGGYIAQCFHKKDEYVPFASAIFAANSLWMLIRGCLS